MSEQVICVLGMHRSGTSFLTGSLQNAGINLGKHSAWNPHNLRGNRENSDIVDFHDKLLASNGGSWDHPPAQVNWQPEHIEQARELIAAYRSSNDTRWGFKDPRTLFTLAGWLQLLPTLEMVGIFRHPAAVVRSIRKRGSGGLGPEDILQLWHQYNRRLLEYHQTHAFPILSFDWPEELLQQRLDQVLSKLGLSEVRNANPFFADGLRTDPEDKTYPEVHALPDNVAETYRQLQALVWT